MKRKITTTIIIFSLFFFRGCVAFGQNDSIFNWNKDFWLRKPVNEYDTIPALFAVSICDSCEIKSMTGYFVRQKQAYKMIERIHYNMEIIKYLNSKKQPLDSTIIFWYGKAK